MFIRTFSRTGEVTKKKLSHLKVIQRKISRSTSRAATRAEPVSSCLKKFWSADICIQIGHPSPTQSWWASSVMKAVLRKKNTDKKSR